MLDDLLDDLRRVLASLPAVRVAYLFGSTVQGRTHSESDLDLAVLFDRDLSEAARHAARLEVIASLTDALGPLGERVDLVDLSEADPAVAFKAIQGRRVLAHDDAERIALEVLVARRYDDDAPRRALYRRAARARWGAA